VIEQRPAAADDEVDLRRIGVLAATLFLPSRVGRPTMHGRRGEACLARANHSQPLDADPVELEDNDVEERDSHADDKQYERRVGMPLPGIDPRIRDLAPACAARPSPPETRSQRTSFRLRHAGFDEQALESTAVADYGLLRGALMAFHRDPTVPAVLHGQLSGGGTQ
jgi:hypothetical protein